MICPKCGKENLIPSAPCIFCGYSSNSQIYSTTAPPSSPPSSSPPNPESSPSTVSSTSGPTNTSGTGENAPIPPEFDSWSWPAFLWSWIWAISHKVYIGLLCLVPFPLVGFVVQIMLGLHGKKWAWQNKQWDSIKHFNQTQRKWMIAYFIFVLISIILFLGVVYLTHTSDISSSRTSSFVSALNPNETTAKAKDTKVQSDAATLISAVERYYSAKAAYPWSSASEPSSVYLSTNISAEDWLTTLASEGEIKTSFIDRLKSQSPMILIKEGGIDASVFACFRPSSKYFLEKASINCRTMRIPNLSGVNLCLGGHEFLCYPDSTTAIIAPPPEASPLIE